MAHFLEIGIAPIPLVSFPLSRKVKIGRSTQLVPNIHFRGVRDRLM